jgi:hypothetical protein
MAVTDTSPNSDNGFIGVGIVYWRGESDTFWRDMGEVPKFEFTPNVDSLDWFSHRQGVKQRLRSFVTQQTGAVALTLQEGTAKNWGLALMSTPLVAVSVTTGTLIVSSGSTAVTGLTPVSSFVAGQRYKVSGTNIPAGDTMVYNGGSTATLDAPATGSGTISATGTIASLGTKSGEVFEQSQINGALMFVGKNDVGARMMVEFPNVQIKPSAATALIQDADLGALELSAEVYVDAVLNQFGRWAWDIPDDYTPYTGP